VPATPPWPAGVKLAGHGDRATPTFILPNGDAVIASPRLLIF
jgi:hypothetical protein